jgi:hypothetical protein
VPHQITIPVLNRGQFFELDSPEDFEIVADQPILVGQFMASGDGVDPENSRGIRGKGDPDMTLLVSREQWRKDYVFPVPMFYDEAWVTIVKPASADVVLDGVKIPASSFAPVGQGAFLVVRIPIHDGPHRLSATEPVSIMVYGYARYVSFAYPGGLNLEALRR